MEQKLLIYSSNRRKWRKKVHAPPIKFPISLRFCHLFEMREWRIKNKIHQKRWTVCIVLFCNAPMATNEHRPSVVQLFVAMNVHRITRQFAGRLGVQNRNCIPFRWRYYFFFVISSDIPVFVSVCVCVILSFLQ